MSPLEMIEEGLKTNNLDLIRQGKDLLNVDKPIKLNKTKKTTKSKTKSKVKTRKKRTTTKSVDSLTDAEYFKYLRSLEIENEKKLINMGNGPALASNILSIDSKNVYKKDQKLDKLLGKTKRKRAEPREQSSLIEVKCCKCKNIDYLPEVLASQYNYNVNNTDSDKPTYVCGKCY